jgi:hypothetical protein
VIVFVVSKKSELGNGRVLSSIVALTAKGIFSK